MMIPRILRRQQERQHFQRVVLLFILGFPITGAFSTSPGYSFGSQQQLQLEALPSSSGGNDNEIEQQETATLSTAVVDTPSSRRLAMERLFVKAPLSAAAAVAATTTTTGSVAANAAAVDTTTKQTNLSYENFEQLVLKDLVQNQFLVNGKLTRSIYDESCTFRDEIDTYGLDQWQKGTSRLFDETKSSVRLVQGSVKPLPQNNGISLRFVEYLCFNVPLLKPIVYLSGELTLERSPETGLITSYKENWDQNVQKVLTSESKLFTNSLSKESLEADLDVFFEANAAGPTK